MGSFLSNLIIILILLFVLFFSVKGAVSHFRGEGSCCGGGGSEVRIKPGKLSGVIAVKTVKIDGMHCKHCYTRVANALNSMDGVNAIVYGKKGKAVVKLGKDISDEEIIRVISDLDYRVVSVETKA
ncbi:MAG: heavy-metal-associated domain-containing protein [Lachnospiraceae bacterium]|nr:heavy-metal-associated domain-containing protein [Lachnospiraceae bacterium]